jgi:hypothetical protein
METLNRLWFKRQRDGSYNVIAKIGGHVGMIRKNNMKRWVACSFTKGVSTSDGLTFNTMNEAGQWLLN